VRILAQSRGDRREIEIPLGASEIFLGKISNTYGWLLNKIAEGVIIPLIGAPFMCIRALFVQCQLFFFPSAGPAALGRGWCRGASSLPRP
jgi:hypothetical protein